MRIVRHRLAHGLRDIEILIFKSRIRPWPNLLTQNFIRQIGFKFQFCPHRFIETRRVWPHYVRKQRIVFSGFRDTETVNPQEATVETSDRTPTLAQKLLEEVLVDNSQIGAFDEIGG